MKEHETTWLIIRLTNSTKEGGIRKTSMQNEIDVMENYFEKYEIRNHKGEGKA